MNLNRLILNHLTLSLLLAISLPAALVGCQSNLAKDNSISTKSMATDSITSDPVLSEQIIIVENLNRFDWKLVRWIDNENIVTHVDTQSYVGGDSVPPLLMDVRPSNLVFKYDCQRYSLHHDGYHNYTYSSYGITTNTPASCQINDTQAASDILDYLTQLFPKYGKGRFNLKVISTPTQTPPKKLIPYELALNAQDKHFIFEGTPKTPQPISGLLITYEFLKTYRWRLVSAVDSNNEAIIELSRPGFPVSAYFGYPIYNEEHHVGFSSDCNGVGGPYILTPDNQLFIGAGLQSMMGCGPKREAAEDKIRELEQLSKSQLTLQQLSNTNIDDPSLTYYLLTQKLDTGETLIWKNHKTVTR